MFYSLKFVWKWLFPLPIKCLILHTPQNKHVYHRIKTLLPIYHRRLIKKISFRTIFFHFPFIRAPKAAEENERKRRRKIGMKRHLERAKIFEKRKENLKKKIEDFHISNPIRHPLPLQRVIIFFSFPFGITLKML